MDADHKQRGKQAETVKGGRAFFHAAHPQTVTMKPPALSPDTWKQPSGTSIAVSAPEQGT